MNTKLTLRLDRHLIEEAKSEAANRGKSLSQMVADFFETLSHQPTKTRDELPPITRSLWGALKDSELSEADYKAHLRKKYL